jgi:hypothetical protein
MCPTVLHEPLQVLTLGEEAHLNTCFKHFIFFAMVRPMRCFCLSLLAQPMEPHACLKSSARV